jgi:hypothetical protein
MIAMRFSLQLHIAAEPKGQGTIQIGRSHGYGCATNPRDEGLLLTLEPMEIFK